MVQRIQKRHLEEKPDYKPEEVEKRKYDVMSILEFTIPQFDGAPLQLRNMFACIPKDDVYVDIHLSKILFKPEEEALFHAILVSVEFIPESSFRPEIKLSRPQRTDIDASVSETE